MWEYKNSESNKQTDICNLIFDYLPAIRQIIKSYIIAHRDLVKKK